MIDLIKKLKALEGKATSGPWEADFCSIIVSGKRGNESFPSDGIVESKKP